MRYLNKILSSLLALYLLAGCDQSSERPILFALQFDKNSFLCDQTVQVKNKTWHLNQLQFFLSNIEVSTEKNKWQALLPHDHVLHIGGKCGETVNFSSAPIKANWNTITAIRFDLGVPFELNHNNPLEQQPPLNQPDMFWVWQTGHKFFRMEMSSDQNDWIFHLGSTGCSSPAPVRAPKATCKNPNRPRITIENFNYNKPLLLDFSALFNAIDLETDNDCQSSPSNPSCKKILPHFGIDGMQSVFTQ